VAADAPRDAAETAPSSAAIGEALVFVRAGEDGYVDALPGILRKTLSYGHTTLMAEFHLTAGFPLPVHEHPHEQTGYLVSGRLRLTIGGETHDVRPGDSWCIPGGVPHGAEVLEDAVAVEVFSPVREDFVPACP
jgi:quercetin dioxygenase-like cupin family protein